MARFFFSVVIPTFNRKELLAKCLDALARQTFDAGKFEVIVVDDGSSDGTGDSLKGMSFPFRFSYVRVDKGGPSGARNAGIGGAGGTYVVLTEDDVVADPRWLELAYAHLNAADVDLLEGRTVYQNGKEDVRRFDVEGSLSFIPCNLFVKKQVFDNLGGYDPEFYDAHVELYFREDVEMGFRILDAGCKVEKADDVIVEHPKQFVDLASCFRHVRRYLFDPLLYKKHPRRFRQLIEAKKVLGITIRRPQHYVALLYGAAVIWFFAQVFLEADPNLWISGSVVVLCPFLYRYKYHGLRALEIYRLDETLGFFLVPLAYLRAFFLGCIRYRSFGALL